NWVFASFLSAQYELNKPVTSFFGTKVQLGADRVTVAIPNEQQTSGLVWVFARAEQTPRPVELRYEPQRGANLGSNLDIHDGLIETMKRMIPPGRDDRIQAVIYVDGGRFEHSAGSNQWQDDSNWVQGTKPRAGDDLFVPRDCVLAGAAGVASAVHLLPGGS